ncbi:MAG: hypothetical protein IT536_15175 [Hyphomicrobiales bacterium]|nr:hypothetical protein [Hyphomicrobiales bacterium]
MRSSKSRGIMLAVAAAVIAGSVSLLASPGEAQHGGPFSSMAGSWSGGGTLTTSSGNSERLRCRARYTVSGGGNSLHQDLRCASDSYRFDLTTNVTHSGGSLSGTFSETSRNVFGNITGRVSGGEIRARAESQAINAILSVTTRGDRQSVSINAPGAEISQVSVSLRRG